MGDRVGLRSAACRLASIVAAVLAIASCNGDQHFDRPAIAWEGEWLRYGADPEVEPACAGTLDYMDGYVGTLVELFDVAEPEMVDFYHVADQARLDEACTGDTNIACTNGGSETFSIVAPQEHELVHAVRASEGLSHGFFEEGSAERWGDDSLALSFRDDADGDVLAAMRSADLSGLPIQHYGLAGRFVAFLDDRNGIAPLNEVLRSTDRTSSFEELAASVEAAYGATIEDLVDEFESDYPLCTQESYRDPLYACDTAQLVPWCETGEAIWIEDTLDCDDPDVLGPRDGEIWKYVAIDVAATGEYFFYADIDWDAQDAFVAVKRCGPDGCRAPLVRFPIPNDIDVPKPLQLEPGRYVIRLSRPVDKPANFAFHIQGDGCTAPPPL